MLEKVEAAESKITIVKLIILIADSNDKKIEFAQKEGFKKFL